MFGRIELLPIRHSEAPKVQFFHLMKMEWKFEVCYVPLSVHQTWVSTTPTVFGSD